MNLHPADGYLRDMKYKDIKRECVIRGMPFEEVLKADVPKLSGYFHDHYYDDIKHELLDQFDDWQESLIKEVMEKKGEDASVLVHPSLRLGYVAERDEEGNVTKKKRAKLVVKRLKKKRERTGDNIFKGTKKAYTFDLQQQGLSKDEVIKKVMTQYPDASEKSISIWYNKSRKLHKIKSNIQNNENTARNRSN